MCLGELWQLRGTPKPRVTDPRTSPGTVNSSDLYSQRVTPLLLRPGHVDLLWALSIARLVPISGHSAVIVPLAENAAFSDLCTAGFSSSVSSKPAIASLERPPRPHSVPETSPQSLYLPLASFLLSTAVIALRNNPVCLSLWYQRPSLECPLRAGRRCA